MIVNGEGNPSARIMIIGEAPGAEEERSGHPFSGSSGQELNRILNDAGLNRSQCFVTNIARTRPYNNDIGQFIALKKKDITPEHQPLRDRYVKRPIIDGIASLEREISLVKPNVLVPVGNVALWALTGEWGIKKWRGSMLGGGEAPKIIPTYHPAAILRQWELRHITVHDFRRVAREQSSREYTNKPNWHFLVRPSLEAVIETLTRLLDRLDQQEVTLSFDLETRHGHIACAGISWTKLDAICIPFMCVESREGYWGPEEEGFVVYLLYRVLTHLNARVIGQNLLYDCQYTHRHWHFVPRVARDTMISHHVAFAGLPKALDFQASMYCDFYRYWKDDGKVWDRKMGEEQLWVYNCEDCVRTTECDEGSLSAIRHFNLEEPNNFQQRLFWAVLTSMLRGVRMDQKIRGQFAMELQTEISQREQYFIDVLGHPLNPRSPQQMQRLFYEDLGQPIILKRGKPGEPARPTLDDEALEKIGAREPILRPLLRRIAEYRSLGVFLSTFVSAPLDFDSRMRCSFNICGTETYRFSSSENPFGSGTNLQNIPKGGDDDDSGLELPNVRRLFIPDPGFTFFDTDLSSADLRIVVWESDEPEFKSMLAEGLDPYTEIAKEFYKDPSITKAHPKRQTFKSFAHGTNYLGSARGLAGRLGLSIHQSEQTQKWYFSRFPRIAAWQEDLKKRVRSDHCVHNAFGYTRYYFDRIDDDVFRQAAAWIPQSTVACIINRAYVNIHENLEEVQVLLQVHDSLAGQFPTHLEGFSLARLKEACKITVPYPDPLIIPIGLKTSMISWGDCE